MSRACSGNPDAGCSVRSSAPAGRGRSRSGQNPVRVRRPGTRGHAAVLPLHSAARGDGRERGLRGAAGPQALLGSLAMRGALIGRGEPLPEFDLHIPLLSLPLALRTELDTIPGGVPYLKVDPAAMRSWCERL